MLFKSKIIKLVLMTFLQKMSMCVFLYYIDTLCYLHEKKTLKRRVYTVYIKSNICIYTLKRSRNGVKDPSLLTRAQGHLQRITIPCENRYLLRIMWQNQFLPSPMRLEPIRQTILHIAARSTTSPTKFCRLGILTEDSKMLYTHNTASLTPTPAGYITSWMGPF